MTSGAYERMMCVLDEYNLGGVSAATLDRIVNIWGGLDKFVVAFMRDDDDLESLSTLVNDEDDEGADNASSSSMISCAPEMGLSTRIPLLIWIDDNPWNNAGGKSYAKSLGVQVISITSTASAKKWIDSHSAFLRANNTGSKVRIISDNFRKEPAEALTSDRPGEVPVEVFSNSGIIHNFFAGESIVRYLRGNQYSRIPVLVYCGSSIKHTRYVEGYGLCGSTTAFNIVKKYVKALYDGVVDDTTWRGYDRGWGGL